MQSTCNGKVSLYLADFASFADVKQLAEDIRRENNTLHVLVNNAGNFYKERQLTEAGLEMTFTVNYLAPFLLTLLLLDLIKASAPARIVNVASSSHKMIKKIDFDNLQGEKGYDPFEAYSLSKLGNVLFSLALAQRLSGSGVTVNSLHPGMVVTNLQKKSYALDGISAEEGASTSVMLASSMELASTTGKYFKDGMEKRPSDLALDQALQSRLWQVSEALVGEPLK